MTSAEIRTSFLKFFEERGHTLVPSSPVIPFEDPTLLFTNAGMNQFKDVFLGVGTRSYSRAADTQKCIRAGGKHNDLEEVGRDTYHHTFFEMLGNWSFGDYYKKEAITWAWELLTKVWGLPKNRLWATVYKNDDEAEQLWKTVTDIDPSHVLRFGEKDNFWEMGDTGPCGPCSEIHIDRTPRATATASMVNAGLAEVMEIWNLVFIQYNRDDAKALHPLPAKHVDTGMGFERICAVLQEKPSNYDTDVFAPLIVSVGKLAGKSYDGRMDGSLPPEQAEIDTAFRVIADHIRTLTFAIADGAQPSNEGRGYVLRRILRRASRFGRVLGLQEPFLYRLVPTLAGTMSTVFPELRTQEEHVQRIIRGEEEGFNATLDRGLERFEAVIEQMGHSRTFPGEDAFKLYDTFGFPIDLTQLMATERGLNVDIGAFESLMQLQKDRSRESRLTGGGSPDATDGMEQRIIRSREAVRQLKPDPLHGPSQFVGYETLESSSTVLDVRDNLLILEQTPFYGESGGQVGDTGEIESGATNIRVLDTQRSGNTIVHILDADPGEIDAVLARVDIVRRHAIMRNHSSTHLLHNALRRVLGTHVHQAGSLVAPDYFRFDFAHVAKMSDKEIAEVEALVNEKVRENIPLTHHRNIPFEEAKQLGALMFFGDKYGDRVNVVQFGEFSKEFCGGTHVASTGEIGYLKIRSEASVASGVRRIEGVTQDYALALLNLQDRTIGERVTYAVEAVDEARTLQRELAALDADAGTEAGKALTSVEIQLDLFRTAVRVPTRASHELAAFFEQESGRTRGVESVVLRIAEIRKSIEKELGKRRMRSLSASVDELVAGAVDVRGIRVVHARVTATTMDELKSLGDSLRSKLPGGVGVLATVLEEKVQIVCVVADDLVAAKRIEAGRVVGAVAKLVGGGGGGRPHMATAGGKDVGQLDSALAHVPQIVDALVR